MTHELNNIVFSPQISEVFKTHNWIININSKNKFHFYFVGDIADYYLKIYDDKDNLYFQFTLDIDISIDKTNEILLLINVANQNSQEGFFIFDFKVMKIKYKLIQPYSLIIEKGYLYDYLNIKLNPISILFHNLVSGVHNLSYGEKIESTSLELLFLDNDGCA